ncbi:hypothetical protein K7432_003383 [Basidiobolus ranarum]|uniref:TM7S3/TM198-like domain-containing protein n=1 Tax=Basidiobolus ranarum TaxID=34480 RepID=A0ABR2WZY7_9FUNG
MKDPIRRWRSSSVGQFTPSDKSPSGFKYHTFSGARHRELLELKVKRERPEHSTKNLAQCISIFTVLFSLYIPNLVESYSDDLYKIQKRVPKSWLIFSGLVVCLLSMTFFKLVLFCAAFIVCSTSIYGICQHLIPSRFHSYTSFKLLGGLSGLFGGYLLIRFWWLLLASLGALVGTVMGMTLTLSSKYLITEGRKLRLILILLSGCGGVCVVYFLDNMFDVVLFTFNNIPILLHTTLKLTINLGVGAMNEVCNAILATFTQGIQGVFALIHHLTLSFIQLLFNLSGLIIAIIHGVYETIFTVFYGLIIGGRSMYLLCLDVLSLVDYIFSKLANLIIHLTVIYVTVLTD